MIHEYNCPLCTERTRLKKYRDGRVADYVCSNSLCKSYNKPLPVDTECECCPTSTRLQTRFKRVEAALEIQLGRELRNI